MTLLLYACTLFLSAALLFFVQPMFGKMVLPLLGGTPEVWNTCMVFFQATLLAGYAYTHFTTRWLGVRRQAILHCLLLLLPLVLLPIGVREASQPPNEVTPVGWLLWLLMVSVGGPFLAISTTAPLLQRWFAETTHPAARDPYFLYGASNLGSMVALLAFPLLIEPQLRLSEQSWAWAAGFVLLIGLIACCATVFWRTRLVVNELANAAVGQSLEKSANADGRRSKRGKHGRLAGPTTASQIVVRNKHPLTTWRRLRWLALALAPSSWMLGVTTHLTTDIAPVPLLWIVPMGLYLLSFILVFARRPLIPHTAWQRLFPVLALLLAVAVLLPDSGVAMALHLAAFFVGTMVCHGELAADRPSPVHLTEFYLWMSLGGVCGGVINALLAPLIFPWFLEYPLAVVLACLLLRDRHDADRSSNRWFELVSLGAVTLLVAANANSLARIERPPLLVLLVILSVPILMLLYLTGKRRAFACLLAVPLFADRILAPFPGEVLYTGRGFFGVHRVIANADATSRYHHLIHGATVHGRQCRNADRRCEPLTYYHRSGPLGQLFAKFNAQQQPRHVAIVGLGTGAMACYCEANSRFTFYEIDPLVKQIAENPAYFSFLGDCPKGSYDIVLGDGRLRLAQAPNRKYDLLIFDAFSSDAVPVHLLTRQALQLYLDKLAQGGLLVFHTSNNHLDLDVVLQDLAAAEHLACFACRDEVAADSEEFKSGKASSSYVVMARSADELEDLPEDRRWRPLPPRPGATAWTDDFSNILRVLRW